MYTVIVKQLLEMQMFRFFECVGVITTAVFISMAVGFFAQDRGIDISFIEAAIAQEDANRASVSDSCRGPQSIHLSCHLDGWW